MTVKVYNQRNKDGMILEGVEFAAYHDQIVPLELKLLPVGFAPGRWEIRTHDRNESMFVMMLEGIPSVIVDAKEITNPHRQVNIDARNHAVGEMIRLKREMERLQGEYDYFLNKYNQLTIELRG